MHAIDLLLLNARPLSSLVIGLALATTAPWALAASQAECENLLNDVDARIASGKYPAYNVQLAKQLREQMTALCPMLPDDMLASMMDGFEELLPTLSEEQRRGERMARRDAETARRSDSRKDAIPPAPAPAALANAVKAGKSVAAAFVDRSEDMLHFWIRDWDTYRGNARILYTTQPSRQQLGRPDWQLYVYVVEITPAGEVTKHLVRSRQAHDHAALALRRGHDEVLFQRGPDEANGPTRLERWSISGRSQLSSVPTPNAAWPNNERGDWKPFRLATSDGNVLFFSGFSRGGEPPVIAWFEASPDGRVLGQGSLHPEGESMGSAGFVRTANGAGAVSLLVSSESPDGIQGSVESPITLERDGVEVRSTVSAEKRILTISGEARSASQSPAIERMLMVTHNVREGSGTSPQLAMRNQQVMFELTEELERRYRGNLSTLSLDPGGQTVEMIQPIGEGYGVLTSAVADRSAQPPIHGPWFLWVGRDRIEREVYLNPLAEALKVRLLAFTVTPDNEIVLYGDSEEHRGTDYLIKLDAQGSVKYYAPVKQPENGKISGIIADETGTWLFGNGHPGSQFTYYRLWVERIRWR